MGIDLATWRARIGLNYYHMCCSLQSRWRSSGGRVYQLGVASWGVGEVTNDTPPVLKGCMTVVALSLILQYVVHSWSKLKGRGGGDKMRCHWRESTSQVRGTVDGGGTLLLRASVVVIPLLLVIAGDVETNPGPEVSSLKALLYELHPARASWYKIGLQLDIPHTTLDCFKQKYTDQTDLMFEVLKQWLQNAVDPPPTWEAVVVALRSPSVNEMNIAAQLESKYCAPSQYMMEPQLKDLVLIRTVEWYNMGLQLGVEDADLKVIQQNYPRDPEACIREMFSVWLRKTSSPSYQQLVEALWAVGENREANLLCMKFATASPLITSSGVTSPHVTAEPHKEEHLLERTSLAPTVVTSEPPTTVAARNSDRTTPPQSDESPFGCGCGKCTFINFIESGCPTPISSASSFPYLDLSGLTHKQQQELSRRLQFESQSIMIQFKELVSATMKSLIGQNVSPDRLLAAVMTWGALQPVFEEPHMPALYHRFKELKAAKTIDDSFLVLNDYFSFFNFHIIEHIIKEFGTEEDEHRLKAYKECFNQYAKRRIFECLPEFGPVSDANYADIFVIVDSQYENYTLAAIEDFRHELGEILHVSSQGILHHCRVVKYGFHAPKKDSADKLQLGIDAIEFSRQHNSETTSKRLRVVFGTADTLTSESLTTTAEEPTLKALLTELHPIRDSWYNIGLQLDIPHVTLNCFQQNYAKHLNLIREVLMYWLESAVDPCPRWQTIVTALRSPLVNENNLADQLESKYCAPVQHIREEPSSHTKMKEREGGVLHSKPLSPSEESEPLGWKSPLDSDMLPGDDVDIKPSLRALLNELYPVRASWYIIGLELGIPHWIMNNINQIYLNPLDLLRETLEHWLQTAVGPRPTWRAVVTALKSPLINEKNIAAQLEEKYCLPVHHMSDVLRLESRPPSEGSEPARLDIDTLLGDDAEKPQLHIDASDPSEGSEPVRKKSRLDIDTLPGDDAHQPQLDIDISGTRYNSLRGVDVVGEEQLVVTNEAMKFKWKNHGLKLHIPENALPEGVSEYLVNIKASLAGQFELPEGYELVSAVYWVATPGKFVKPVTIETQHCANFTNSSQLHFVCTSCTQKSLPYKFKFIDEGVFTLGIKYGALSTTRFSGIGVVKEATHAKHSCQYCAQVYFTVKHLQDHWYYCHFVITKDLEICLAVVNKKYQQDYDIATPITFDADDVALDIPRDGTQTDSGWEIVPVQKAQIKKERVDNFLSGNTWVPECVLLLRWLPKDKVPEPLIYKVNLLGTGDKDDFFRIVHHPEPLPTTSGSRLLKMQLSAEKSSVEGPQVELTVDDHLEVTNYLLELGKTDIHSLGLTLGLHHRHLKNMGDSETFRDDMIDAWLQKEDQVLKRGMPTWETLVKALRDRRVNQTGVADKIEKDKMSATISST